MTKMAPTDLVRALIFDFDGLICDTEGAQLRAAQAVFHAHDAELPVDRWVDVIGRHVPQGFWLDWLEELAQAPVDRIAASEAFDQLNAAEVGQLAPNSGVVELLEAAHALELPCAVASSSSYAWVEPMLSHLGLAYHFDTVVCREAATHAKPAPDLYHEALKRLGLRGQARAVLAFEDSRSGSIAATTAGLRCVAVPHELTRHQDFTHVEAVVDSLADVELHATPGGAHVTFDARLGLSA